MKIAVIFTGGTIGSASNEQFVSLSGENSMFLTEQYRKKYEKEADFSAFTPYFIHSENLTFDDLSQLTACVSEVLAMDFDGIIITHGTDTLQFTAAAMSLIFSDSQIPIVLVSSNFPLADKRANGLANFASAVDFISRKISAGVFVSYRNRLELPELHSGTRLLCHPDFSDELLSARNQIYGSFANSCFIKNPNYSYRKKTDGAPLRLNADFSAYKDILFIRPYVGIVYPQISDNIRAVLLTGYHSGTLRTRGKEFADFCDACKEKNVPVFLTGILNFERPYESTGEYKKHNVIPLYNITPITAYIKLVLLLSESSDNLAERMNTPVTDEFFE